MVMERFIIPGRREEGTDLKPVLVCERYKDYKRFKCTFYEDSRDGEPVYPAMDIENKELGSIDITPKRYLLDVDVNKGGPGETHHFARRIEVGW